MPLKNDWADVTDSFYAADQNAVADACNALAIGRVSGSDNGTPTNLTVWVGSEAEYALVDPKDSTTLYFCT